METPKSYPMYDADDLYTFFRSKGWKPEQHLNCIGYEEDGNNSCYEVEENHLEELIAEAKMEEENGWPVDEDTAFRIEVMSLIREHVVTDPTEKFFIRIGW